MERPLLLKRGAMSSDIPRFPRGDLLMTSSHLVTARHDTTGKTTADACAQACPLPGSVMLNEPICSVMGPLGNKVTRNGVARRKATNARWMNMENPY